MDVYRLLYPPGSLVDCMELESFAKRIGAAYGIDLFGAWKPELTLGDVFTMARQHEANTPAQGMLRSAPQP